MCENNERYDCKTARWIQKTMQCMWILNIIDAWKNQFFGKSRLNSSVFEKLLISYSSISFMKYCALRSFCIKLFYFSKSWFFHASFMFRIHMYCIHFFVSILQWSYLSLFSHITCIHIAKLGTQLDLTVDWLIFELCTF